MEKNTWTKRDCFEAIKAAAADGNLHIEDFNAELTDEDIVTFCDVEIGNLDKKAAKAKEALAKKRAEGDALTDAVRQVLTAEPQTIADVAAQIEGDDVTTAKVQYRLVTLFRNGEVEKCEVTVPGVDGGKARKVVAYSLPQA
jgi:hypothetical protein